MFIRVNLYQNRITKTKTQCHTCNRCPNIIYIAPINSTIDSWNAVSPPQDWEQLRNRWEHGHFIRSYIGLAGLATLMAAIIWET